ncbi:hypothetical protein BTHE_1998 [Bifidobacterium thermophilum]|nr:hypothetical protein BTHE_1998 [Bifidobacterium thermophilum]
MLCHVACYLPSPVGGAVQEPADRAVFAGGCPWHRLMRLQEPADVVVSVDDGGLLLTAVR